MQPVFDFIRTQRTNPFFIWFAPVLPHRPHNAPEKYRSLYRDTSVAESDLGYYANISWFDDGVGELVDFLDSAGLREQTLIIYVIDNGWTTGGSGIFGGLKGKGTFHEQGFRTPVVFNWPGRVPGGTVRESLVSIVDLFPTALDYAGLRTPADRPGGSLRPIIEGDADRVREFVVGEGDSVVWVKGEYGPVRGRYLRDERWHYIELLHRSPRLFDVARDPDEVIDVMRQHLDVVAESRRRIESELARHLEMLRD
jgi:uncharacterized sulfatase